MTWRIALFTLGALAQLVHLGALVWRAEVAQAGKVYRFRTAPIDPVDAFRGRYVRLNFPAVSLPWGDDTRLVNGEDGFATLELDAEGSAQLLAVVAEPPEGQDVVPVRVIDARDRAATVRLAFDRFYLNEHEAPRLEARMRQAGSEAIALVRVNGAHAVLEDLDVGLGSPLELPPLRERIAVPEGVVLPDALVSQISRHIQAVPAACAASDSCLAFPIDLDASIEEEWLFAGPQQQLNYFVEVVNAGVRTGRYRWSAALRPRDRAEVPTAAELRELLEQPGAVAPVAPTLRDLRLGKVVVGVP